MSAMRKIRFVVEIGAPPARVYDLMIEADSYRDWTSAFAEGSCYEGSWQTGSRIRFLGPGGHGMVAEIAENRPHEFISIRHLGLIANGVEDTGSAAIRAWAPAYENYTLLAAPGGTRLCIDQEVPEDFAPYLCEAWPKALQRLRAICEAH